MRSVFFAVVLASSMAIAQESGVATSGAPQGQAWSVVGARTVGQGGNLIHVGVGWPGLSCTWFHGVASNVDLGARGSFLYGVQGLVQYVYPGFAVQAVVRFKLVDSGALSLAATFEPGPFFNSTNVGTVYSGFAIPLGLRLGIAPSSALTLGLSLDVPMWVQFGPGGGFNLPILPGLGVEYFVSSTLNLYFKTSMGPMIRPWGRAEFAFNADLGVGIKL